MTSHRSIRSDVSSLPTEIALLGHLEALTFDHDSVSMPDPHFHVDFEKLMNYLKTLYAARSSRCDCGIKVFLILLFVLSLILSPMIVLCADCVSQEA